MRAAVAQGLAALTSPQLGSCIRQLCSTSSPSSSSSAIAALASRLQPAGLTFDPSAPSCSYSSTSAALRSPQAQPASRPAPQSPNTHRIPYALRSGTPRPAPWPVLEPVAITPSTGAPKWHRSLYRFPEEVQAVLAGRELALSGRAGTIRLDLKQLDPTGLLAFKMMTLGPEPAAAGGAGGAAAPKQLLALATPDKKRFDAFLAELEASVRGVSVGYLVGITVKGVGYRIEPMPDPPRKRSWYFEADKADPAATTFPYPSPVPAVRVKVGYSQTAVFPFPPGIRAFCIKPSLLYLYGLRKEELDAVAAQLRSIRKPNVYTGNGIQLLGEVVRIKQRKASK